MRGTIKPNLRFSLVPGETIYSEWFPAFEFNTIQAGFPESVRSSEVPQFHVDDVKLQNVTRYAPSLSLGRTGQVRLCFDLLEQFGPACR